MNGDRAVKYVEMEFVSVWLCAPRRVMERDIESPTMPAVDSDQKFKNLAIPTNAPSGKSRSGQG
jgi:hypothetical protein